METSRELKLYGLVAEFANPDTLVAAANSAREAGYKKMDAYTPFPVHDLAEAVGNRDDRVPWIVFICGILGAAGGFSLQYWVAAVDYPLNVGGRPFFSWPSFIPVTFECTILFAAFGAFIGMLALNGLPKPYHSIFNAPRFDLASQDRFFLCIEAEDAQFDRTKTEDFMRGLNADRVSEVEV